MAVCRGCGAEINWIKTRAGKSMPVDPEPVFVSVGISKEIFITDDGDTISGRAIPANDGTAEVAFVPHWATCPAAHQFRR